MDWLVRANSRVGVVRGRHSREGVMDNASRMTQ
jgi:hypothetical protein